VAVVMAVIGINVIVIMIMMRMLVPVFFPAQK